MSPLKAQKQKSRFGQVIIQRKFNNALPSNPGILVEVFAPLLNGVIPDYGDISGKCPMNLEQTLLKKVIGTKG